MDVIIFLMNNAMNEETFVRVTLRLPKRLHERVATEADRKTSTTNAEVVSRLEMSFLGDAGQQEGAKAAVTKEDLLGLKTDIEALLDRKLLSLVMALNAGDSSFGQKKS